jgi:hypothetical protein
MLFSLTPHTVYRIADNIDRAELRGKQVVFVGWCDRPGDTRWAVVRRVNDGATDEEYLISANFIIPLNSDG